MKKTNMYPLSVKQWDPILRAHMRVKKVKAHSDLHLRLGSHTRLYSSFLSVTPLALGASYFFV